MAWSVKRYWKIFEERRAELGYADYLGALQRYRDENPSDPNFLEVSHYLLEYSFADRLYAGAMDVIAHLGTWGPTVILSDGDVIFQPRKVERSGLYEAVEGRVLIYIHKEQQLDDVENRYPARHYVLIDDKLRILTAVKTVWEARVTTVFPRQGLRGLRRLGKKKWRRAVADVVARLKAALVADYVVLGGGNAKRIRRLSPDTRLGDNHNAFLGGVRLWEEEVSVASPSHPSYGGLAAVPAAEEGIIPPQSGSPSQPLSVS